MVGFIIGLFVGGFFGVAIMSCLSVASEADDQIEKESKRHTEEVELVKNSEREDE